MFFFLSLAQSSPVQDLVLLPLRMAPAPTVVAALSATTRVNKTAVDRFPRIKKNRAVYR
jgi:hypothetical protein